MTIKVKVLAQSKNVFIPHSRITTFSLYYPLRIHNQLLTHRAFSRNSASSRAIPALQQIEAVEKDPYIPRMRENAKGMTPKQGEHWNAGEALKDWMDGLEHTLHVARRMVTNRTAKELIGGILAPYAHISTVLTCNTDNQLWLNFLRQREDAAAQEEISELAYLMRVSSDQHATATLYPGEWHLPIPGTTLEECAGRLARWSYGDEAVENDTKEKALARFELLTSQGHLSPLEHVATPLGTRGGQTNLRGWIQLRYQYDPVNR